MSDQDTVALPLEPTDAELQAKYQAARSKLPPSSLCEPLPTFSVDRSDMCRRCKAPLAEDRFALCPECDAAVAGELAAKEARDAEESRLRRLRMSGLPKAYASGERTIETLPPAATDGVTLSLSLGATASGLYLWGEAGSYKTSVAAATLARAISAGTHGRYVFVPDLFTDLYAIYSAGDRRSRADVVDALIETPCLVLDDLGKEKASEHAAAVIFEILDGRYRHAAPGRWLIVTSNLPLSNLCARFAEETGEPIARRISEMVVSVPMTRSAA